jgi:very-short-patch-repair endonuclease
MTRTFRKHQTGYVRGALENMGYDVLRIKNEQIQNTPDSVAERIIQRYFEVADDEDIEKKRRRKKLAKIWSWKGHCILSLYPKR